MNKAKEPSSSKGYDKDLSDHEHLQKRRIKVKRKTNTL
jgi:hypothetical protein